jgi:hypothetical protein
MWEKIEEAISEALRILHNIEEADWRWDYQNIKKGER